jgi:hypothetical protein
MVGHRLVMMLFARSLYGVSEGGFTVVGRGFSRNVTHLLHASHESNTRLAHPTRKAMKSTHSEVVVLGKDGGRRSLRMLAPLQSIEVPKQKHTRQSDSSEPACPAAPATHKNVMREVSSTGMAADRATVGRGGFACYENN